MKPNPFQSFALYHPQEAKFLKPALEYAKKSLVIMDTKNKSGKVYSYGGKAYSPRAFVGTEIAPRHIPQEKPKFLLINEAYEGCYGGTHTLGMISLFPIYYFISPCTSHLKLNFRNSHIPKDYINWLVNYSPYRHAFAIKDVDFIAEHGGIFNSNVPWQYAMHAAVALRYTSMAASRLRLWHEIREEIGDLNAFILMHRFEFNNKTKKEVSFRVLSDGHCLYDTMNTRGMAEIKAENLSGFVSLLPISVGRINYTNFASPYIKNSAGKNINELLWPFDHTITTWTNSSFNYYNWKTFIRMAKQICEDHLCKN